MVVTPGPRRSPGGASVRPSPARIDDRQARRFHRYRTTRPRARRGQRRRGRPRKPRVAPRDQPGAVPVRRGRREPSAANVGTTRRCGAPLQRLDLRSRPRDHRARRTVRRRAAHKPRNGCGARKQHRAGCRPTVRHGETRGNSRTSAIRPGITPPAGRQRPGDRIASRPCNTRCCGPATRTVARGARRMRPGGLEPPTCGFSDPPIARRAGPSLHPCPHKDAGRFDGNGLRRSRLRGGIAGAAHPLVSTPSVGRAFDRSAHPADGSARDRPRARAGFPEFTRFASTRRRAGPLFPRRPKGRDAKETAALSC